MDTTEKGLRAIHKVLKDNRALLQKIVDILGAAAEAAAEEAGSEVEGDDDQDDDGDGKDEGQEKRDMTRPTRLRR